MHVNPETGEVIVTIPLAETPDGPIAEETPAAQRLLAYVERIERLNAEKKAISDDQKDLLAEAKSAGFDGSTVLAIVKRRARKPNDVINADRLLAHYSDAIGAPTAFTGSQV